MDPALHGEAQVRYRASLPSGTSFVDQVSLLVLEREGIGAALPLDPDVAVPGVTILPTLPP